MRAALPRFRRLATRTIACMSVSLLALATADAARAACTLGRGNIKHVVYLQFDNVHLLRDNPNVPSDLEQMPYLKSFLTGNGMLLGNDHTQLISHTANGILTSISGVYPDRLAAGAISNTFNYYNAQTGSPAHTNSTFVYWTDPLAGDNTATGAANPGADTTPVLLAETGKNAPAPWVAYTRAGCDFGAAGISDMDLENTTTDLATVFGRSSPEYAEGTSSSSATRTQAVADFEGIALHCAQNSAVCAAAASVSKASPDVLPDEPGGYTGFQGVFGHRYVVPALMSLTGKAPSTNLADLDGNTVGYLSVSNSGATPTSSVLPGFPGFDGLFPTVTLSYAATMLEAGVPVVYGYLSDAHDHHYATADGVNAQGSSFAYGPGEQGYVNQLKSYDSAFGKFFTRLAADGIDKSNTLFVILVEEGDQFGGSAPVPVNCDGVTIACTYPPIPTTAPRVAKGEVNANLDQLLASEKNDVTPFSVHTDQAPAFYLSNQPGPTDATARQFERNLLGLTLQDPYNDNATENVLIAMADRPALQMLHMVTADAARTPTAVGFDQGTVYAGKGAVSTSLPGCAGQAVCTNPAFAWNHGGITHVVRTTWSGMVGPGVRPVGRDDKTWADHVDTRATMFALLGLTDDYAHDGRVLAEDLMPAALPRSIGRNTIVYEKLAAAYKQLTAPFGLASTAGLRISTAAIGTGSATDDHTYGIYQSYANSYLNLRDPLIARIKTLLNQAEAGQDFNVGQAISLTVQAQVLTGIVVGTADLVVPK